MKLTALAGALVLIFTSNAMAQPPSVGGVLNNYSYMLPGLPNYGIAPGSIFALFGTNFSVTSQPLGLPLPSQVDGLSISVTVNGTTTHPFLYYISPTQINAVLPSATPAGQGTVALTNSAGVSAGFPIEVVPSAFGLLTTSNGAGQAVGFDANNSGALFGFTQAVNPGEILELWGTGLGPVANDATDVAITPPPQVFIGGVAANVLYAGRSSYTGLDQINVQVPAGLSGCYVAVAVQTGNYVSNFATLPVAASGRTCADASNPLPASLLQTISQTGTANVGLVWLAQTTGPYFDATPTGAFDFGFASFAKSTASQLSAGVFATGLQLASQTAGAPVVSAGGCVVNFSAVTPTSSSTPPTLFQSNYLNAGADAYLSGPDGVLTMPPLPDPLGPLGTGDYQVHSAVTDSFAYQTFAPPAGGNLNFANGAGGPDVGPFNVTVQVPPAGTWTWTNGPNSWTDVWDVTRASGLTLNWTGGDPSSYVSITGVSFGAVNGGGSSYVVGTFTCLAPAAAGTFAVPPAVLLALPVSYQAGPLNLNLSSILSLTNLSAPAPFTAAGLDAAWVESSVTYTTQARYQ